MQNVIDLRPSLTGAYRWNTIILVALFHILAVASLFVFSFDNFVAAFATWWIAGSWGIGLGFHRLLTHRGFTAPRWLMRVMATCGTLAVQSGPITWVTTHRIHHAFTDTHKDPHSPRHGTYWSHIGWIFRGSAQTHSEAEMQRYSPDLMKDGYLRFLDRYYYASTILVAAVLFAIGGVPMVLAGIFLRTVVGWHFTWLVNSVTHIWGSRRFDTRDDSRNNGLIALVTFGEGWHNNHHAYPRSARHGLTWREFDINWVQLRVLEMLGLVTNVYAYDLEDEEKSVEELRQAA